MKKLIINEKLSGIRIDKALMETKDFLSRAEIQRLLDNEEMLVNSKKEKASYKTKIGDVITYEKVLEKEENLIPEKIPLDVIYEDNDILVINKAKGMVVHPGNGNHSGTLANAIMSYSKDSLSGIGGKLRPRHSS